MRYFVLAGSGAPLAVAAAGDRVIAAELRHTHMMCIVYLMCITHMMCIVCAPCTAGW
jgi:hypothetical protein